MDEVAPLTANELQQHDTHYLCNATNYLQSNHLGRISSALKNHGFGQVGIEGALRDLLSEVLMCIFDF